MSQENVQTLMRAVRAFDARDIDALTALMTDDHEWFGALLGGVEGGSYRGRAGMERYFSEAEATWEDFRSVVDECRDLGDRVLVIGRLEGRGKTSGVIVDTPFWMISDFHAAKLSRTRAYLDEKRALSDAGLTE